MSSAIDGSIGIVAYLTLFLSAGLLFVFAGLLVGRFLRPKNVLAEKGEIYECGEPSIGSSFVQFDLRFYVVALVFIIFDVEVAFLFPWATVFGKANHLSRQSSPVAVATTDGVALSDATRSLYRELGVRDPHVPEGHQDAASVAEMVSDGSRQLLMLAVVEVLFFFLVLLIAFAYEWKEGALDWVRALVDERSAAGQPATDT